MGGYWGEVRELEGALLVVEGEWFWIDVFAGCGDGVEVEGGFIGGGEVGVGRVLES